MEKSYNLGAIFAITASLAMGGCGENSLDRAEENSHAAAVQAEKRQEAYMIQCRKENPVEPIKDYCRSTAGFYSLPKKTLQKS